MEAEASFDQVRKAELDSVREYFKQGAKVLEIGGGSGFQASLVASWGCEVVSVDLPDRPEPVKRYFPVRDYDGARLSFPDRFFDLVFSSNVLEHVESLPGLLAEVRRVLMPQGLAVHLVPTAAWRFWTITAHYPYAVKVLLFRNANIPGVKDAPNPGRKAREKGALYVAKRILFPRAHGAFPNAATELYYFRKSWWTRIFQENGFKIRRTFTNGLFYTGYGIFPAMTVRTRRKLAALLGASCNIYVMSPE